MIRMKIDNIDSPIECIAGNITTIKYENIDYCYEMLSEFSKNDFNKIIISKNFEPVEPAKYINFIPNLLDLDLNNKKIINQTHKSIVDNYQTDLIKQKLALINQNISQLLDEILYNYDGNIIYKDEINLSDILNIGNVKYADKPASFITGLVIYISNIKIIHPFNVLIIHNLYDFLKISDLELFKKEIELFDVFVLNIETINKVVDNNTFIIDDYLSQIC